MAIWLQNIDVAFLNQRGIGTMTEYLGIEVVEIGDDFIKATMPVSAKTIQPLGFVHGGANVVLAETVASMAANMVVDINKYYCVGMEINANHIRSVTKGLVTAITRPIHIGRNTQVWTIELFNDAGEITCMSRMTAAVVARVKN
jgi:1,4-dihydroxy-2-naphthoyl-CoA hydrolase